MAGLVLGCTPTPAPAPLVPASGCPAFPAPSCFKYFAAYSTNPGSASPSINAVMTPLWSNPDLISSSTSVFTTPGIPAPTTTSGCSTLFVPSCLMYSSAYRITCGSALSVFKASSASAGLKPMSSILSTLSFTTGGMVICSGGGSTPKPSTVRPPPDGGAGGGGKDGAPPTSSGTSVSASPLVLIASGSTFSGPLPNATFVAPVIPAPPRPPFRPASSIRSKLALVKKSLFWATKFSAAMLEASCNASVPPSVTNPSSAPLPIRLAQAAPSSLDGIPDSLALRSRLIGVMASRAALKLPAAKAAPRSCLPVFS